ncbi:MAG: NAD(P)H-dependent oxidoreductase subunit E [Proteobacteria bacterium]|nr:NAD(P)H-dependent oxidoreductase subunit E [Pseudomonadota bacterium]
MSSTAVLIVGHGSRQSSANLEFETLVAEYRAHRPELDISHGYVELADPPFEEALHQLAGRADRIVLMPLFLLAAGHVKNDIPLVLSRARQTFARVHFAAARPLGVHPALAELAFERARSVLPADLPQAAAARTAVIMVGRGSSDPDANGDFYKITRIFGEGRGFAWVEPSFIGITWPRFEQTIELVARSRPQRIIAVPYFLFAGRLIEMLGQKLEAFSANYPWIKTALAPHLGVHPALLSVLDERLSEALQGHASLPCDNCQYRRPIGGVASNVGGLQALLWSVRHTVTHSQAMPHVHAHKPLRKHIFVCGNVDCASRGSIPLITALRRQIKEAGKQTEFRVTRTSCMGRCGEGPTVSVYPDGVWYRGVAESDARDIVEEHLLGDRLVARLVDNIMQ